MTRQAILIESSHLHGEQELPGARVDVLNWRKFLRSNLGGAWEDNEIATLSKPSWAEVQRVLRATSRHDYVFITFSGHGYHVKGQDLDESRICLNESDEIPVRSINPGNPRCSFVVDACRQMITEESLVKAFSADLALRQATYQERPVYRQVFNQAVAQAEMGIIRLYACDLDEAAGESSRSGGYYSDGLMRCSTDWHEATSSGHSYYLPASEAHTCAFKRTNERLPQQHPQYEGGRRNKHFPLAVRP